MGLAYRDNRALSFKSILLQVMIFALPVLGSVTFPVLAGLLFFLTLLVLPAAITILALSDSLADAINPVMQWRVISVVGSPW